MMQLRYEKAREDSSLWRNFRLDLDEEPDYEQTRATLW
jgi:hypothetical protein